MNTPMRTAARILKLEQRPRTTSDVNRIVDGRDKTQAEIAAEIAAIRAIIGDELLLIIIDR